jgi:hypothetical protein
MRHLRVLSLLVLLVIAVFSLLKGCKAEIQDWGQPYWVIDYSQGFIKRGLIGQIFGWITSGASLEHKWNKVLQIHLASCILLLAGLAFWCWRIPFDRPLMLVLLLFVSSQFLPTLSFLTGYLDIYLYILLAASIFSVARGSFMLAIVLGFIGPFIHESYIFPWMTLPLLLVGCWRDLSLEKLAKSILVVVSPVAASVVVSVLHSPSGARNMVAKLPLSEGVKNGLMQYQFGQTIQSSLSIMLGKMVASSGSLIISLLFFGFPTMLMILIFNNSRVLTTREKASIWLASCAPITILGLAWDLSRFIVSTNLCALFSILFVETAWRPQSTLHSPQRKTISRSLSAVACAVVVVYFASPLVFTYFEHAYEFRPDWLPMRSVLRWLFSTVYKD